MKRLILIGALCCAVLAQQAEPRRITFKRGASSGVVRGVLRGSQQDEYLLGAREGQRVAISLYTLGAGPVEPRLQTYGRSSLQLVRDGRRRWSAQVPQSGDYLLWFVRQGGARGTSTYRAVVEVR